MRIGRGRSEPAARPRAEGGPGGPSPVAPALLALAVALMAPPAPAAGQAAAADSAWRAGDVERAERLYERVVAADSTHGVALHRLALARAWDGRHQASLELLDRLLELQPDNAAAAVSRARVLAWSGRLAEAAATLDRMLAEDPERTEARRLRAVLQAWRGDLVGAERRWRVLVEAHPHSVESRVGLARVLRWQGRPVAASRQLEAARKAGDEEPRIRGEARQLRAVLAPSASPSLTWEGDTDTNEMLTAALIARTRPLDRLEVRGDAYLRSARDRVRDRRAEGAGVTATWHLEPGWDLFAGAGAATADDGAPTRGTWRAGVSTPPRNRVAATLTLSRRVVDATAAMIENSVIARAAETTVRTRPAVGWSLRADLGWAEWEGDVENRRLSGSVAVDRDLGGRWHLGGRLRAFGFERDLNEGYFDPDLLAHLEAIGRWRPSVDRWRFDVQVRPGLQQVGSGGDVQPTVHLEGGAAWEWAPGRRVRLGGTLARAGVSAFATGAEDYVYRSLVLEGRWSF